MKKDIVNETFQKHLKLLHEHLNINEYFYDQDPSQYKRVPNSPSRWDDVATTGGEMRADLDGYRNDPRDKLGPYVSPEEKAREKFSNTVAGYARNNGFDVRYLIRYLNQIEEKHRNNWKETDDFIGSWMYDPDKFEKNAFKRWAEQDKEESDRDYERRRKKDKEEAPAREINSAAENIRMEMTQLIHSIGTIRWQVFKLKNPEEKLKYLSDYFEKNEDKLKSYGKIGPSGYNDLKPYFDKYSNNDEKAKLILLAAIKAMEKDPDRKRGFFEQ